MSSDPVTPFRPANLTARITDRLGRAIVAGEFDGKKFPIEADIATMFDASRSVTREAVKMLTAKGLVSSRPRHGTQVAPQEEWNFLDPDVLRWILDRDFSFELLAEFTHFRRGIEPRAAVLACRNMAPGAHDPIFAALEAMREAGPMVGDSLEADIAFHVAILEASGNRFIRQCRELTESALRFSIRITDHIKGVRGADVDDHEAIAQAIARRDEAVAKQLSIDLLDEVEQLLARGQSEADFES